MSETPSTSALFMRALLFRPFGVWIPPALAIGGAFALAGLRMPGLWFYGAAGVLTWVLALVTNARFRAAVAGDAATVDPLDAAVARLDAEDRDRFERLRERCEAVAEDSHLSLGLGELASLHLQLLRARAGMQQFLAQYDEGLARRSAELARRLSKPIDDELAETLKKEREGIQRRLDGYTTARKELEQAESELRRVEDEVEYLREQSVLGTPAASATHHIDSVTGALSETREWLAKQSEYTGISEDEQPIPVPLRAHTQHHRRAALRPIRDNPQT
jgi:hypothetical protein